MKTNGNAVFKNKEWYLNWFGSLALEDAELILETVRKTQKRKEWDKAIEACADKMFRLQGWHTIPYSDSDRERWEIQKAKFLQTIQDFLRMTEIYQVPIRVGEWHEENFAYLYMGNPNQGIIVPAPELCLDYIPEVDYSSMSPMEVRASLALAEGAADSNMLPAEANALTVNAVKEQKGVYEDALAKAKKELEKIQNGEAGELAAMKAEIERLKNEMYAKKDAMMAEMREKMAEMEAMKENLENQIYLLDSQIYAILCFAGETVKFGKVKSGRNAPDDTPIVIYQKLHFLDEDMGRLASIYDIQWNEVRLFEEFLAHSSVAQDTFVPNERCISLVRLSKDAKVIADDSDMPYQNMLAKYDYYHGKTIGILIRNGENIYVGWTDENRIHIEDDLLVSKPVTETEPGGVDFQSKFERERWEEEQKAIRKKIIDGVISRSFVYNILQGVVERTPILPLPTGVTLGKQSEYVVYSMADAWLSDNRYGNFTDILERCNERVMKGDMVLTMRHLMAEHDPRYGWARKWDNVRGRGEMNRTHDVEAEDCTIYPVNLVEFDKPVLMTKYKYPDHTGSDRWYFWETEGDGSNLCEDSVILEQYEKVRRHVFISLVKSYSYTGAARANFEIYSDEYINLTYMNSVWLEYVITNKSLGGWTVKSQAINYAYAIRYLKTALDYVRAREVTERGLLDAIDPDICKNPEWPVALSEWKLEKGVREMNEYQAKRFVKSFCSE